VHAQCYIFHLPEKIISYLYKIWVRKLPHFFVSSKILPSSSLTKIRLSMWSLFLSPSYVMEMIISYTQWLSVSRSVIICYPDSFTIAVFHKFSLFDAHSILSLYDFYFPHLLIITLIHSFHWSPAIIQVSSMFTCSVFLLLPPQWPSQ
jgi:hypothetical protein